MEVACIGTNIRAELRKLGFRVSKRAIQKHLQNRRGGQRWRTFLRNHTVWACDYFGGLHHDCRAAA